MEFTASPARSLKLAIAEHARVIHALMLRDIKTRMGGSYFGFLLGLILPLGHIGVILAIYVFLGRRAPIGNDVLLFLASGILPFIIWSYTHQKIILSFSQNSPLTSFPIVKTIDIPIARALVEFLNSTIIVCVVLSTLAILDVDLFFQNPHILLFSGFLAYMLGVSTGLTFGILSRLSLALSMLGFLLIPLFWVASGTLFIPDSLPEAGRTAVSFFALAHIVDLSRTALFPSYISSFPSLVFVSCAIIGNLLFSIIAIQKFKVGAQR